jgi:hypothetical protein
MTLSTIRDGSAAPAAMTSVARSMNGSLKRSASIKTAAPDFDKYYRAGRTPRACLILR